MTGSGQGAGVTGPELPYTGNDYIYFETSSTTGHAINSDVSILESILLSDVTSLSFYYHMCGAAIGTLEVDYFDGTSWINAWSLSGQQQTLESDPWIQQVINLQNLSVQRLRFVATAAPTGCCVGDIALDDIVIQTQPTNPCTFSWSTNSSNGTTGWSATNTEDIVVTSSSDNSHTGTYTITTSNQSGCSSTDNVNVSVTDIEIYIESKHFTLIPSYK